MTVEPDEATVYDLPPLDEAGPAPEPQASGTAAPISEWDCPSTHPIKGNAQSGIYHVPGGAFYDRTKPELCFATEADAQAAGLRRSLR